MVLFSKELNWAKPTIPRTCGSITIKWKWKAWTSRSVLAPLIRSLPSWGGRRISIPWTEWLLAPLSADQVTRPILWTEEWAMSRHMQVCYDFHHDLLWFPLWLEFMEQTRFLLRTLLSAVQQVNVWFAYFLIILIFHGSVLISLIMHVRL